AAGAAADLVANKKNRDLHHSHDFRGHPAFRPGHCLHPSARTGSFGVCRAACASANDRDKIRPSLHGVREHRVEANRRRGKNYRGVYGHLRSHLCPSAWPSLLVPFCFYYFAFLLLPFYFLLALPYPPARSLCPTCALCKAAVPRRAGRSSSPKR